VFTTALQATVKDSGGNPVSGVAVTFTAPGTGPSGLFGGSLTANVVTNGSGIAVAPTLTANSQAGGYTMTASVGGVATLASFSLTNTAGSAASIVTSGGTPQSTTINTVFTTALQATVKDSGGNPVSGVAVTFTAPGSGPSGLFGASLTANVVTNASGIATAPTLTASSQTGGYPVTASVSGVATLASFSLTNTGGGGGGTGGSLAGSVDTSSTLVNLTTEGSVDWVHWGDASLTRKAGVTAQLSSYTVVGSGNGSTYGDDPRFMSWTDGTPTASSTNNRNGVYINVIEQWFSFTAPADTTVRTLVAHLGGWSSGGTFTAHLSDGSAVDFTDTPSMVPGQYDRNYTLTYKANSAGQTLTLTWKMITGNGNVTLNAAALQ